MKLYKDNCLFEIDFKELFESDRISLKYEIINRFVRPYGFVGDHSDINKYKIDTLTAMDRNLSEWILIFNSIVIFLDENKISWIPGKCPFIDNDKCGFLIFKKTYLIVVTIDKNGSTNTKEYPLGNSKKLI